MSLESKITFTARLNDRLSSLLTLSQVSQVMEVVSDTLKDFDIDVKEQRNISKDDLLELYISAMKVQGRSPMTIQRYQYIIGGILKKLKISSDEITVHHLRNHLSQEKARGLADSTLDGFRQVYSAYFNWLQREGLIKLNPTANLGNFKKKKKIKDVYSDIDIERLKQGCDNIRDKAIICFLLSTACRVSEMTQLNIDDVDLNNLECTVLGKGDKERVVYIDTVTAMILKEYLSRRTDDNDALFVGLRGNHERINPCGVRCMLKKLGQKTHVSNVHPHKFRRTKATDLIRHGMPIQEVAAILGHEKLDTTMEYVVMDKTTIKTAYAKYA